MGGRVHNLDKRTLRPAPVSSVALAVLLALAASHAACKKKQSEEPSVEQAATSMSELYGLRKVPTFEIRLSEKDMESLREHPKEWRKGDFAYGGQELGGTRVRLKGHRSMRSIDDKPSFKLRFDKGKANKARRFLGLQSLTLNNLVEDPTMIREYLAYRLARKVGLPVPKVGYAQLRVNDQDYGLYLVVETPDEDFLERRFGTREGELYEGEYGCDLREADVSGFDQDVGSEDRGGLREFALAVSRGGSAVWQSEGAPMTIEHLSMFLAFSNYAGDFDGYHHSHNYRIYRSPVDNRWQMMSWGLDRSFFKSLEPYSSRGLLAKRCFAQVECRRAYLLALREVHRAATELDLQTGAQVISSIIGDSVKTDPKRSYDGKRITKERAKLVAFLQGREAHVADATACLSAEGTEIDGDGDGFACMDCDDLNADVHPGAEEVCDGMDNNCSGLIDDHPTCKCNEESLGAQRLEFCQLPLPWLDAQALCVAKGGQLASPGESSSLGELRKLANRYDKDRWWLGGTDGKDEGSFHWSTGGPVAPELWAKGQPDNSTCNQDCTAMHKKGKLHDTHCGHHYGFICQFKP